MEPTKAGSQLLPTINPGYAFAWAMVHLGFAGLFAVAFALNVTKADAVLSWRAAGAAISLFCAMQQLSKVSSLKVLSITAPGRS